MTFKILGNEYKHLDFADPNDSSFITTVESKWFWFCKVIKIKIVIEELY